MNIIIKLPNKVAFRIVFTNDDVLIQNPDCILVVPTVDLLRVLPDDLCEMTCSSSKACTDVKVPVLYFIIPVFHCCLVGVYLCRSLVTGGVIHQAFPVPSAAVFNLKGCSIEELYSNL